MSHCDEEPARHDPSRQGFFQSEVHERSCCPTTTITITSLGHVTADLLWPGAHSNIAEGGATCSCHEGGLTGAGCYGGHAEDVKVGRFESCLSLEGTAYCMILSDYSPGDLQDYGIALHCLLMQLMPSHSWVLTLGHSGALLHRRRSTW